MKNVILYNHSHNGDIFYSRILLNMLSKKYKIHYFINPFLKPPLLSDVSNVTEDMGNISHDIINYANSNSIELINVWIGRDNFKYVYDKNLYNYGCSFENHFAFAKMISHGLGVDITEDPSEYLPTVNYEIIKNYDLVKKRMNVLLSKFDKIILISNGQVESGQSENFDFEPIIKDLASQNNNILFLVTKKINTSIENILDTSEISQTVPDLLQISYMSTFCSVIVGRASGPYCYTHTKDNFMDENKIFIAFTNYESEGIFYEKQKSKHFWSNNYDAESIKQLIQKNI